MKIPFLELKPTYDELRDELDAAYHRVMDSGWYLLGNEIESFEAEFAKYCEAKHCVAVGNGLDALHLILRAYDIGAGDEVIVPTNTFIATWLAVSYAGATPVPVEPDPKTFNLDPGRIEAAITPQNQSHHAGASLRPAGGHGSDHEHRPQTRVEGHRGQRPGTGRPIQGPANRFARRCGRSTVFIRAKISAPSAMPAR